jgi:hypothetical protein
MAMFDDRPITGVLQFHESYELGLQEVTAETWNRAEQAQPGHARVGQLLPACSVQRTLNSPSTRVVAGDPVAAHAAPLDVEGRPSSSHKPNRAVETPHDERFSTVQSGYDAATRYRYRRNTIPTPWALPNLTLPAGTVKPVQ